MAQHSNVSNQNTYIDIDLVSGNIDSPYGSGVSRNNIYTRSNPPYAGGNYGHRPKRPHSRRKFIVLGAAVGTAAVLGGAVGVLAHNGLGLIDTAKAQAAELNATASQLMESMASADFASAHMLCPQLATQAANLKNTLDNRLVSFAENLTDYGSDIRAARTLLDELQSVTQTALEPLTATLERYSVETLLVYIDGEMQIDIAGVQDIINAVMAAIPAVRSCFATIEQINKGLHVDQLKTVVDTLRDKVGPYIGLLDVAEQVLPLVPGLLGAYGPRTYLMVAQTNSEIAATGGFPGAMGYAYLDNGRFDMGSFTSVFQVIPRLETPLYITDEERLLFGDGISYATDTFGHNPDFPRAAELWAQANEQVNGFPIDGVLALDPVFLQTMLGLTGSSVAMSDGSYIDGSNAAQALLNSVYWNYLFDSASQDAYFSEAASGAAEVIMSSLSSMKPQQLLEVIAQAFEDRRLNLWLSNPQEEDLLRQFNLDGGIEGDISKPELGVFLNDAIWSKIEWYLHMQIDLGPEANVDGARTVPTTVTLTNTITYEEAWAANGNAYIVGYNEDIKREDGDMGITFFLYAPTGGTIVNYSCDETPSGYSAPIGTATHKDRAVVTGVAKILPGESIILRFDTVLPSGCTAPLEVDSTPLGQGTVITRT